MAITVVGTLEADLPGGVEYKEGGIGPLFGQERVQEAMALFEVLSRTLDALTRLEITDVVTCYIDDVELFRDADDDERKDFEIILEAARSATADDAGVSLHLMLAHDDPKLSHIITVEASIDHAADEAAISVLDVARSDEELGSSLRLETEATSAEQGKEAGEAEGPESDWGFASDSKEPESEPLEPVNDDVTFVDERAADTEDLVDAFLQRVQAAFERELGIWEPEIDVWTDWEGVYAYSDQSPIGGLPGITG